MIPKLFIIILLSLFATSGIHAAFPVMATPVAVENTQACAADITASGTTIDGPG
jgi:hypothetical protein